VINKYYRKEDQKELQLERESCPGDSSYTIQQIA